MNYRKNTGSVDLRKLEVQPKQMDYGLDVLEDIGKISPSEISEMELGKEYNESNENSHVVTPLIRRRIKHCEPYYPQFELYSDGLIR